MEKFTVAEFKKAVYEEFKDEINLISKNSEKENSKADIGVEMDMFIMFIDVATESIFVNVFKG